MLGAKSAFFLLLYAIAVVVVFTLYNLNTVGMPMFPIPQVATDSRMAIAADGLAMPL